MKRRSSFASPVVFVVVASCHGSTHSNPPGPVANPPSPKIMSIDECQAVKVGEPCAYDHGTCSIGAEENCGLQGYECKESAPGTFTWAEHTRPCEPAQ